MHDDPNFYGPHWDAGLIGANGRLARLHKGSSPPPAPKTPPPVRENSVDVQQAKKDEREKAQARNGYSKTLAGSQKLGTLFGGAMPMDSTGRKTLFGQ